MLDFRDWLSLSGEAVCEGSNPGAKTGLYPLGYGGVGLYPPQWYPTRSADAIFYMSIDERIYKGRDGGSFDITHIPGDVNDCMNGGEKGIWDITHIGGLEGRGSGRDIAAKSGEGRPWSIRHIKGGKLTRSSEFVPASGDGGMWDITGLKATGLRRADEVAGTFAIVGCGESPNYQVWGARSDLKCKSKKGNKTIKMKFKDWVDMGEKKNGR